MDVVGCYSSSAKKKSHICYNNLDMQLELLTSVATYFRTQCEHQICFNSSLFILRVL
jgi:hypothetical protein